MNKLLNFLKSYETRMLNISERDDYHPEPTLWDHIQIVFERAKETGNINLQIAALFHDIGKVYTYEKYLNSYGHEITSAWITMENWQTIEEIDGADFDLIYWLVKNHLVANQKPIKLTSHKWWSIMEQFIKIDDMVNYHMQKHVASNSYTGKAFTI